MYRKTFGIFWALRNKLDMNSSCLWLELIEAILRGLTEYLCFYKNQGKPP